MGRSQLYHVEATVYDERSSYPATFGVTATCVDNARRAVEDQPWRGFVRIEAGKCTPMGSTPKPVFPPLYYH